MLVFVNFLRLDFELHTAVGNQTSLLMLTTFLCLFKMGKVCVRYSGINKCLHVYKHLYLL